MRDTYEAERHRQALIEWFTRAAPHRGIALTLTPIEKGAAGATNVLALSDALRVFCRMLQRKAFGRRFDKGDCAIAILPVREGFVSNGKRIHYHLFVEVPPDRSVDAWSAEVAEVLRRIKLFSSQVYDIRPVRDTGWIDYMLKAADKPSIVDALEVSSMYLSKPLTH